MGHRQRRELNLEFLERIPTVYSSLVQLDPGHLGLARIEVRGRDSFIVRIRTGARSIWTSVPEVDWIGYSIPITWKGDYLLNGMSATRNTVFKLDGAHEFDVVAESRDFITFGIRRSVLSRMISCLIGRNFAISVDTYRQLHVPEAHRERLLGILFKPLAWAPSNGSEATFGRLPRSVEVAMIEAIADWTIEADQLNYSETVNRKSELRIVRDSLRKIREADCSLLTIADLCRMAGVGKSRLHQAFSDIYGMSPGAYLYRLRLTSIREKLVSEEAPPRSVKDVAIQHGFLSSGQFARAYKNMFGELPSQAFRVRHK
ncbi:helix-turn-helix domain-containing protein [Hoeflea sp. WL0058]|uniref:Helix-turn-helix domain-containing protein n=1 Tax=Flavimaribacter sediminis TaxID=2865987 RepID=A0AAE2ZT48_9HYPH|nr:helix-turn-helix domain-containing protein [Flavimaribacter sediminis]MBW8640063.1 helix-turn-helix domain-containing protein [Flavimaribacter sediminis]